MGAETVVFPLGRFRGFWAFQVPKSGANFDARCLDLFGAC